MAQMRVAIESFEPRVLLSAPPNPLVNDPTLDTTGQDTQSENSTLAFGSTVLVSYNDSGSNASSPNQFTGWLRF